MNGPRKPNARKQKRIGLGFKLAALILCSTTLIFATAFLYFYHSSKEDLLRNARKSTGNLAWASVLRIETVIDKSAEVPRFLASLLEQQKPDKSELYNYLYHFIQSSPDVFGSSAAYEPYEFDPGKRLFAPYAFKSNGMFELISLEGNYDYLLSDWYLLPKYLERPVWSEPYYDEGGGGVLMTTLSVPMFKKGAHGRAFTGVVTADISLTWLQEYVSKVSVYRSGYAFLVSRNGVFVSHPDNRMVMRESLFSLAEAEACPDLRRIGQHMIQGGEDFIKLPGFFMGRPAWMYYAPVPSTGWSVGIVVPEDELYADLRQLARQVAGIGVAGFCVLFVVVVGISLSITRPLKVLAASSREIAKGNLDTALPSLLRADEVGDLSHSFERMRLSLKHYIEDLTETTKSKERMESELRIARDIQMGILPKIFPPFPERTEFEIHACLEPAREVGGDLYDFFFVDERRFCFLVGDVSDKGVPAAFFMAVAKTLLKIVAEQGLEPGEVLARVNDDLAENNESCMFVTLFLAVLDIETGEVQWSNAGHPPPLLLHGDGGMEWFPPPNGPLAGAMEGASFGTGRLQLKPGDQVYAFTDGVTEAMNEAKELFGEERLWRAAEQIGPATPEQINARMHEALKAFTVEAAQSDDITMLTLRYLGVKAH